MRDMSNSHRSAAASLHYNLRFVLFMAAASLCDAVAATSYARLTPQEITERTDAWIHVHVKSISSSRIEHHGMDPIREINMRVDVLDSTDNQVSKVANLQYRDIVFVPIDVGNEGFVAVRGRARNSQILDVYDWIPITPASLVETSTGPVTSSLYWRWVCGLRRTADAWGKIADEDLNFWKQNLDSDDTAVATLAVSFFQWLDNPPIDAPSVFAVLRNAYERMVSTPPTTEEARYEIERRLSAIIFAVRMTLRTCDTAAVGPAILDFIEYDGAQLSFLKSRSFRDTLLPLLRYIKDPQTLARVPRIRETYFDSTYSMFESIPNAPSPEIDEWLWDIVRDPAAYGIETDLDLAGVWAAMERRDDLTLLPYLHRVADGSETPPVKSTHESMPLAIRDYATSIIKRFEK